MLRTYVLNNKVNTLCVKLSCPPPSPRHNGRMRIRICVSFDGRETRRANNFINPDQKFTCTIIKVPNDSEACC